jgi:hypothetical protein
MCRGCCFTNPELCELLKLRDELTLYQSVSGEPEILLIILNTSLNITEQL